MNGDNFINKWKSKSSFMEGLFAPLYSKNSALIQTVKSNIELNRWGVAENLFDTSKPTISKVFEAANHDSPVDTISAIHSPRKSIRNKFHPYAKTPTRNDMAHLNKFQQSVATKTNAVDFDAWEKYRRILAQYSTTPTSSPLPSTTSSLTFVNNSAKRDFNQSLKRLSAYVKSIDSNGDIKPIPIHFSTPKRPRLSTSAPLSRDMSMVDRLQRTQSEISFEHQNEKIDGILEQVQSFRDHSLYRKWQSDKNRDDHEQRQVLARALEKEIQERGIARAKREAYREQDRRLLYELEGLVIERPKPAKDEFPKLSLEADELIERVFDHKQPSTEIFADGFDLKITRKDLLTLKGLQWLNDEIIFFYLNLIMDRSKNDAHLPKVYVFNTFFYTNIATKGYASVKRWTRKFDIFAYDLLLIPVHLSVHWTLATIDFRTKKLYFYDSMLQDNPTVLRLLQDYLESESRDKRKKAFDFSGWTIECLKGIPRQMNGSDCGMFALKFAEYASRDAAINFSQEHMPYFRRRMVYEICSKSLL